MFTLIREDFLLPPRAQGAAARYLPAKTAQYRARILDLVASLLPRECVLQSRGNEARRAHVVEGRKTSNIREPRFPDARKKSGDCEKLPAISVTFSYALHVHCCSSNFSRFGVGTRFRCPAALPRAARHRALRLTP